MKIPVEVETKIVCPPTTAGLRCMSYAMVALIIGSSVWMELLEAYYTAGHET
jgi:hypothetical protein